MPIDPRALLPSSRSRPGQLVDRARAIAVLESAQASAGAGVIHLDLDRFHRVNAQWGQRAGDRVLQLLGPRLARRLPHGAVVAPLKGDSFLVVVPAADPASTRNVAELLLDAVREPIAVDADVVVAVRASAGIACQAAGQDPPVDLVEHAFLACRRAKGVGGADSVVDFEDAIDARADRHQQFEDELRQAIEAGELRLYLQPELDLHDGRVAGAEALIRWQHPVDGLRSPALFLPEAERAGLMTLIGDWVVDEAIDLAERCRAERDGEPLRIWVNLAAQQLADGEPLCDRVREALGSGRITARCIGFEVTESSLLEDLPGAVQLLQTLREMGVEIALDDFGTGYSSLSYLRQLPVTAVKIDQQFVAGIGGSLADEAIIEAVIDLAHALGLRVIAEGIEDVTQAEVLIRMGADQAQGYHFGRPMPVDGLLPLLSLPWCGAAAPSSVPHDDDRRAEHLPGFGSPRARLLMAALDTARDSIIVTAAAGGDEWGPPIVYVNAAFEAETGFRSEDVIGKTVSMLLPDPPDLGALVWFTQVHAEGKAATIEMANRRADGSTFLCELTVSPVSDERGVHTHWLHVRRDLTQRRAAEGDRARFQGLIEQTTSLVFLAETGGQWVYANAAQRRAIGVALDAPLDGVNTATAFSPTQQAQIEHEVLPALQQRRTWQGTTTFVNPATGERTEVVADVQYVDDPLRPGVRFFAAVSRDVTQVNAMERAERRRRELGSFAATLAQRALEQSREMFVDGLEETLGALGSLVGADFVFLDDIDLDAGLLRPLGSWGNGRHGDPTQMPAEVPLDRIPAWIERLQRGGVVREWRLDSAPWSAEMRAAFPGEITGVGRAAPLRVGGVLLGVLGMANGDPEHRWSDDEVELLQQVADTLATLIERHRAAEALRLSEARLSALLANVSDLLIVIDRDGWIRYTNERLQQALGLETDAVVGQHFVSFVYPDDQHAAVEAFAMTLTGQEAPPIELRLMHADGTITWYDADTSGVDDPIVGGYMISLRDVTAQHLQLAAAERQSRFERVVLQLSQWALEVPPDEIISGLNVHLADLGRALGTDVAFAALLDGDTITNVAGWSRTGGSSKAYELPEGNVELPALVARYQTLEPLVVDDIDAFEGDWVDEWRAFPVCDRAGLNVPLVSGGSCLGNLGVAMHHEPRQWQADEIAFVRRVSETVGALIDRHQVETSLRASQARLAALLDASHDMVVVVGVDGTVLYTNLAVDHALGYPPDSLVGRSVLTFVHPDDAPLAIRRLQTLHGNEPTPITVVRLLSADGTTGWWEITSGAMHEAMDGGRVLMCRDVTARVQADSTANRWVELLRFAFDVAQMALDVDAAAFMATLPQVCRGIGELLAVDFAYVDQLDDTAGLLVNRAGWIGGGAPVGVQPGDAVPVNEVPDWVHQLGSNEPIVVADTAVAEAPWVAEKLGRMGPERSVMAMGMSSAGQLFGVLGCSMASEPREWNDDEITFLRIVADTIAHVLERARLDEALRVSEARFRLLSDTALDLVMLVDSAGFVRYASPSSLDLLGWAPDELVGRAVRSLVHPDDIDHALQHVATLLEEGSSTSEQRVTRADGSWVWVSNAASTVIDPETGLAEYRVSLRDITERKRLEDELARQVLHDQLTGLGNRMLLQTRLEAAATRRDPDNQVAVLLLDLDGFKQVNDTYGHAVGDEVLRVLASRLQHASRAGDTVARTGGDEFVLLCPETAEPDAVVVARRVVDAVSAPVRVGDVTVHVGASVGVAHAAGHAADPDMLLIEADHAMYAAKRAGRGRVVVSAEGVSRSSGARSTA
jgi:diguanylate cyclase (GGDEF)-like protein/PAS domain S-box-containing protein